MQEISGVSLLGYWMSNMISDVVKAYIPIFITLILQAAFSINVDGVWVHLLIYPWTIVPFTYITSFLFTKDSVAQIMTLFVHFLGGGILPLVIFVLLSIPSTVDTGSWLRWIFTLLPTFDVCYSIILSTSAESLKLVRQVAIDSGKDLKPYNSDLWAWSNLLGNAIMMLVVGIVCLLLLILFESNLCVGLKNLTLRGLPEPKDDLDLDEDVIAEAERLDGRRSTVRLSSDDPEA